MKSYLFICFFAASLLAALGHYGDDEALEAFEGTQDEILPKFEDRLIDAPMVQEDSHNMTCDCPSECDKLHVSRLPHDVRVCYLLHGKKFIKKRRFKRGLIFLVLCYGK